METNNVIETNQVKQLTIHEKLKYFFTNPNKIFEDYNTKPTWLVKMLIITALTMLVTFITMKLTTGSEMDLLLQQQPNMTKEEVEAAMQFMKSPFMMILTIVGGVIGVVGTMFLAPLIYWGLISAFGGKTAYMKVVAVYTLAYIPYYVGSLISLAISAYNNNFDSLLKPQLMDVLLGRLDVFVLWQLLLLIFGFSKIAKLKLVKSSIVVAIMWLIVTGISIGSVFLSNLQLG